MEPSATAKLATEFAQDESAVLNALDDWLSQFDMNLDEEGTPEFVLSKSGDLVELTLKSRIRTIADAMRLATSKNKVVAQMVRNELPKSFDLDSLHSWAFEQQVICTDVLQFLHITHPSDDSLVTVRDVASHLKLEPKSLVKTTWPQPFIKHSGRAAAKWKWSELLPALKAQYPDGKWHKFGY